MDLSPGLTPTTLKVYVAAISAWHNHTEGASVGKHVLVSRFLRGARWLRPLYRPWVPSWDLSIVIEGLSDSPFKPLESASEKLQTFKVPLLVAITSLKRIGDLQALSVTSSCLNLALGLVNVILHPKPHYVLKVPLSLFHPVVLQDFSPPPFETQEQERLNKLCPVQALRIYVHCSGQWHKSDKLFVCFGGLN